MRCLIKYSNVFTNCRKIRRRPFSNYTFFSIFSSTESSPLLLLLTGVLGCVVIVALTMVVILCQRNAKKPPPGNGIKYHVSADVEKNQCKESDNSSNISDITIEFRTGSSVSRNTTIFIQYDLNDTRFH